MSITPKPINTMAVIVLVATSALFACTTGRMEAGSPGPDGPVLVERTLRPVSVDGFGNPNNRDCGGRMIDSGTYLYTGADNGIDGTLVYRSKDKGETWELISSGGIDGNPANEWTTTLVWFEGMLYVGTWQVDGTAMMFRANADAANVDDIEWELIEEAGFGSATNTGFTNGMVFDGHIYVATFNLEEGSEVWRSATGDPGSWEMVIEKSWGREDNSDTTNFFVHDGYLYAGTEMVRGGIGLGTALFRTAGGPAPVWEQVAPNGYGERSNTNTVGMTYFKGQFYAGTWNLFAAQIWRSTGSGEPPWDWELVFSDRGGGRSNQLNQGLAVLGDELFYCSLDNLYFAPGGGAFFGSPDGTSWIRVTAPGFLEGDPAGIIWMLASNDRIYLSLYSSEGPGELWVYE